MTVENIKKYINENTEGIYESIEGSIFDCPAFRRMHETLENVKSMLDELEQPIEIDTEKYFEQIDKLIDREMAQHLVDHMKQALKKEIERNKHVRN